MTDALDLGGRIKDALERALVDDGHSCTMAYRAEPVVQEDRQVVVCGCGYFAELPDDYLTEALAGLVPASAAEPGQVAPPGAELPAEQRAADIVTPSIELVDPGQILTPDDLAAHIIDANNRLERGAAFVLECIQLQFSTKALFTMARAKAVATSKASSMDRREAEALVSCEQLYNDMIRAEMMARAAREMLHNLRSILSGYQSVGRAVTATYESGGSPSGRK